MKARHIKKIRAKLKDENFLMSHLKEWAEEEKILDNFYRFQCSDFFEGKTGAEINRREYYKRMEICRNKLKKFKRLLDDLTL